MATVQISNLKKSYGAVPIMHGVDVPIADGEFVILVGPSGCGKSTLLRMIAGLESVTAGEISIDGRRVNELEPKDRDIAMVFQNYALYPQMTVAQNMGFALELAGRSKADIKAEVDKAADILSLSQLLDRKPAQLSGGQRQRVAMGRAIVRHPKVFLFDEPLSNLDAKLRVKMRAEIKALHQRLKSTIVYVTHDQIEAMTMADKIVVMNGGRVEQIGSPLELYDNPNNLFVATFMGSPAMNILPAKVTETGITVAGLVQLSVKPNAAIGTEISYGIRPDDVGIGGEGAVPVEVQVVEPTGAETHVTARLAGQEITIVSKDRLSIKPGEMLMVGITSPRSHMFETASGKRI
ncbi:sn-glycerol-3-phosphate ABC transporter ATP-binding protein UgpC [Rhizobium lentis]|uniref:ABC transporter ATP-binding protein n=1 Tax=Rhizobium TaxID=379 RepID=UPI001C83543E|nr:MULTISPECIES: sn-glycerol-3-phosphate ABC transporter ATP-binding protein UgpC [Rhizobium]MBX5132376.1 sn-glycerol-3-phosphate ABC transporter ATP-binding protein UgpC [Rhizobium lentis]MBX5213665.1 sn-glycerol-3-phosphate ABC transporter ATP-binding protein UgpC [Rhizobium sp. NLR9a]MBX5219180.1 sn-glycerol-3-phosphate ABC transporter ATP-binding protein UgpC [Rhizobium sp. NLR8a]MBX5275055.1 sn-glycerol-3-phosphate ABC transporter ATP-binding protein UgpC [Rhizobium sp. NLR13a]MBX5281254.